MISMRTMKKWLATEDVYYVLHWCLTPIQSAPPGGDGTTLGNSRLPAGRWFRTKTRQSGETAYVFFADRDALEASRSRSVLRRDILLQHPDGSRQTVSPHGVLHWLIYT